MWLSRRLQQYTVLLVALVLLLTAEHVPVAHAGSRKKHTRKTAKNARKHSNNNNNDASDVDSNNNNGGGGGSGGDNHDSKTSKLISRKPKFRAILDHADTYASGQAMVKHVTGDTLVYVTPWNNHGYDVAKIFARKFDYVSPTWFLLRVVVDSGVARYEVVGDHDVDAEWVSAVRSHGSAQSNNNKNAKGQPRHRVKIVPRFTFDGFNLEHFRAVFSSADRMREIEDLIYDTVHKHGFNGMVLDCGNLPLTQFRGPVTGFLRRLGTRLHARSRQLVLVIPPIRGQHSPFDAALFADLAPIVDRFSLMTYDYANARQPGPNAPISWCQQAVQHVLTPQTRKYAYKILMGLNFYGNNYVLPQGGGPIIGSQYKEILETHRPSRIIWDDAVKEHSFTFTETSSSGQVRERKVFYPTLKSIQVRLDLAATLGVGISVWEIGQGLDYFYDLM